MIPEKPKRSLPLFVIAIGLGILVAGHIFLTRSHFIRVATEFSVAISWLTSVAFSGFLPFLMSGLTLLTLAIEIIPDNQSTKNAWNTTLIAIALLCFLVYWTGIGLFLVPLLDDLA